MEKDNRSQNGLLYIMEALDRVQCIVKDLQLAVGEMYENGYKMRIPSSYQNITLGLQPIEISMNSFNQYLLQNSMKADEYNNSWIGRNVENNDKNTTKELIFNGSILLNDTTMCIAKIDRIEKDQSMIVITESESNSENDSQKNSVKIEAGVRVDVLIQESNDEVASPEPLQAISRPRRVRLSSTNRLRLSLSRRGTRENITKPFKCQVPGCDYSGSKSQYLTRHMQKHQKNTFSCTSCTSTFNDQELLDGHIHEQHGDQFVENNKKNPRKRQTNIRRRKAK